MEVVPIWGEVAIDALIEHNREVKLPPDFERTLSDRPTEELCEMLANAEDYLPEALEAARAELGRRALPQASVTAMVESASQQRIAEQSEYRHGPLDPRMRILVLILGLWAGLILFFYYRGKGCGLKAMQSLIWILYHFLLLLGLVVVSFTLYYLGVTR